MTCRSFPNARHCSRQPPPNSVGSPPRPEPVAPPCGRRDPNRPARPLPEPTLIDSARSRSGALVASGDSLGTGASAKDAKTRIVELREGGEGLDFLGFHHRWVRADRGAPGI